MGFHKYLVFEFSQKEKRKNEPNYLKHALHYHMFPKKPLNKLKWKSKNRVENPP
jgi:hypothetical protein